MAELIYYALYPALFCLARTIGWNRLLWAAYACAGITMWTHPTIQGMQNFGYHLTWIVGLPCWLLGCQLAECLARDKIPMLSWQSIWWPRLGMFLLSIFSWQTLYAAKSYLPANAFITSLQIVGITAYFWLAAEIRHFRQVSPNSVLEWAGTWSYSLYLVHELGRSIWDMSMHENTPFAGLAIDSLLRPSCILALCYVFHRLIEVPSHHLARATGNHLRNKR